MKNSTEKYINNLIKEHKRWIKHESTINTQEGRSCVFLRKMFITKLSMIIKREKEGNEN